MNRAGHNDLKVTINEYKNLRIKIFKHFRRLKKAGEEKGEGGGEREEMAGKGEKV